ncbi:MAG: hypothetical protein JST14_16870 [Bacteroidetes bacterium]|nr:hypothetical protein [Bacteroidota bacterium]
MTPFEYVSVLISIILGLGITQIMTGLADMVHQWDRVKFYTPHTIWILMTFVLHIQEWWITYQLRTVNSWPLLLFLFMILYPVTLFILARILFPSAVSDEGVNLQTFFRVNRRKFYLITMVLAVLSIGSNSIIYGVQLDQLVQVSLILVLGWVSHRDYPDDKFHLWLAWLLLLALSLSIGVNWEEWQIAG